MENNTGTNKAECISDSFRSLWSVSTQEVDGLKAGDYNLRPPPSFNDDNEWEFSPIDQPPYKTLSHVPSSRAARLHTTNVGLVSTQDDPSAGTQMVKIWGANITVDLTTPSAIDGGANGALFADGGANGALFADGGANGAPFAGLDGGSMDAEQEHPPTTMDGSAVLGADLSAYSGLVFWAKASSPGNQTIHVMIHDEYSEPRGGKCDSSPSANPAEKCFNAFSKSLDLTESFTRYDVPFSDLMRDSTWGKGSGLALDLTSVYVIAFEVRNPQCVSDPNARCAGSAPMYLNFDFWIDDLYLVNR
jgi:hypothetical protein